MDYTSITNSVAKVNTFVVLNKATVIPKGEV